MAGGDVRTILFTDLVGSTQLRAGLGDDAADPLIAAHLRRVADLVEHHDGVVVKTLGDGVLATFRSARRALICAGAIQRTEAGGDDRIEVRIGLDAGEVMERDGDVHGLAVAAAARIAGIAGGGDVLVGELVRRLAGPDPALRFDERDPVPLKGMRDPVRVGTLRWADVEPALAGHPEPGPSEELRAPALEISLLGKQQVLVDGAPLPSLRSARTLELLAYLVVHRGTSQLRQHLAGVMWPDSTDSQARTNLRRELHQLRDALPEPDRYLAVDAREIRWDADAPCRVDVADFETALDEADAAWDRQDSSAFRAAGERAVRAYGGDLLPGLYVDWVLTARDRLRRSCVALLDRLAGALADAGDVRVAVEHARRRVELEPLEESGYRNLMELQGRAGDRAAALATYHRCASVLERELEVEPSPDTMAVHGRLIAETATPAAAHPSIPAPAAPAPADAPFVGRSDELQELSSVWAKVAGGPRFAILTGEAGMGKTRLAAELADAVRREGAVVANARCFASTGRLALAPVAEWLRSPALRPGLDALDPVWRTEVTRLVPELAVGGERAAPVELADPWQRRRFLEGLAWAVLAGQRETLLVLDDLQWCDAETLAWIETLLGLDRSASVLVLATVRTEERGDNPELVALVRRLHAAGTVTELELAPLTADESARIAASFGDALIDGDAALRLQATTGGVPLFVVEAARQGSDRSPRVEALLEDRLAQLSPAAQELAGIAAAVGRDFSLELLGLAAESGDDELVGVVDELWQRRLLRERSGTTYDFSHDLFREAAYARISPPRRRFVHRRVADALEQLHHELDPSTAAQIAEQRELGGQPDRAIRFARLAGDAAAAVYALREAVRHYERALALLDTVAPGPARDRHELELRQAMMLPLNALHGYASSELGVCAERAVVLSEELGEERLAIRSLVVLWTHRFVRGRIDEAMTLTDEIMSRGGDDPEVASQAHMVHGASLASIGRAPEATVHFEQADRHGDSGELFLMGFHVRAMAQAWRAHAQWLVGSSGDAAASADAALAFAEGLDHPYSRVVASAYGAITACLLGDVDRTAELAVSVRTECERYDFAYYGDWGRILEGWASGGAAGEALLRQGIDNLRTRHAQTRLPFYLALLAEVLVGSGRTDEAARVLAEARALAHAHGDRWWLAELWRIDGGLRSGGEGRAMLERALTTAREQGSRALELRAATDLARRDADEGGHDAALALLAPVRAEAVGCNPVDLAAADAVLAGSAGTPDDAA